MTQLEDVTISDNRFSGDLAAAIDALPNLRQLDASRNEFTGHFPAFTSTKLRDINLRSNALDGTISSGFICDSARTESKLKITAYNNQITGGWPLCATTPGWFAAAEVHLILHDNLLSGSFFTDGELK